MAAQRHTGSGGLWGPLFGGGARTWSETWEGDDGWGGPAYEFVLSAASIGDGTKVLDCGCGAGRFLAMAAQRGADVAGLDAAEAMIEVARQRVPGADLRVGDFEALPWADGVFDVVTGFSAFQFAADKVRALSEARRVCRGVVAVVVPVLDDQAGVAAVYRPVFPLFSDEGLARLRESGIFALSAEGALERVLAEAGLTVNQDTLLDCPVSFRDIHEALDAFMQAGPTALAIDHSGEERVASALRQGLEPFRSDSGVRLPGRFRAVIASG